MILAASSGVRLAIADRVIEQMLAAGDRWQVFVVLSSVPPIGQLP